MVLPIDFFPGNSLGSMIGRELVFWFYTAVLLLFVRFVEREPLSVIGLRRPTWKTLVFGLLGGAVMTAAIAGVYIFVYPLIHAVPDVGSGSPLPPTPMFLQVAIVVRAAVFEEVFYRGFAIEHLTVLTRSRWIAAAISFIAFTAAHLSSWAAPHLLVAGAGGIVLTALYLWRRDLPSNMIAHFITDAIGFLVL